MSIRDEVAAESKLRFWVNGLRFPLDCRIRVFGLILDRHEGHGIVATPGDCTVETWWEAFYDFDPEAGVLRLRAFGLGVPFDRPPGVIVLRAVQEDGCCGFGCLRPRGDGLGEDAEAEVRRYLL